MSLVGSTLTNGVMVEGGTDHLKKCLCENFDNNTMPETCKAHNTMCQELVEEITSPVFSSLATWLEDNTNRVCSFSGSGLVQMSSVLLTLVMILSLKR